MFKVVTVSLPSKTNHISLNMTVLTSESKFN